MRKLAIIIISISLLSCEQLSMVDNNNLKSIYPMTKKINISDFKNDVLKLSHGKKNHVLIKIID